MRADTSQLVQIKWQNTNEPFWNTNLHFALAAAFIRLHLKLPLCFFQTCWLLCSIDVILSLGIFLTCHTFTVFSLWGLSHNSSFQELWMQRKQAGEQLSHVLHSSTTMFRWSRNLPGSDSKPVCLTSQHSAQQHRHTAAYKKYAMQCLSLIHHHSPFQCRLALRLRKDSCQV